MNRRLATALALVGLGVASQHAEAAPKPPIPCRSGFVFRQAAPDDRVCVAAETQRQVAADNAAAADRVERRGAEACRRGYVWREAYPGDHVCVAPRERDQAEIDNQHEGERHVAAPVPQSPGLCRLVGARAVAQRLGLDQVVSRPNGHAACTLSFDGDANAELNFAFDTQAEIPTAAADFHRLHERPTATLPGLGDEAVYEARSGIDRWRHVLAARHGNVTVEVAYEGDPAPSGIDALKQQLVEIARAVIAAVPPAKACAPLGESTACAITIPLDAMPGSLAKASGTFGPVRTWFYSVAGEAGDTIAVELASSVPVEGEMGCPDVPARRWTTAQLALRLPRDGQCVLRLASAANAGAFNLTIRRR